MSEDVQLVNPMLIIDEHEPGFYKHYIFTAPKASHCGMILADKIIQLVTSLCLRQDHLITISFCSLYTPIGNENE